ncbi:hypothetical protein [Gemmata sp.]|uniref:hypothetical protein n=1 Tax=Gemmata sp. TaxID=1914242 RepID=UPI003F6E5D8E
MAFLVCYSWSPPDDHTNHRALYLNQRFYELIYNRCRAESGPYAVLREIALLRYKSPTLVIAGDRLARLAQEIRRLAGWWSPHPQLAEFRRVCAKAMADGCALTISGDMYPELWRAGAEPLSWPTDLNENEAPGSV